MFSDLQCLKYTIVETLDKDDDNIKNRIQILTRIINQNPSIFHLYIELDAQSPLVEEEVHVDLLKALFNFGENITLGCGDEDNLVSTAAYSEMNETQVLFPVLQPYQ